MRDTSCIHAGVRARPGLWPDLLYVPESSLQDTKKASGSPAAL